LAEGADSTGGATVPTYLVGKVIDQMRSRMVAIKAGAKTLALETQTTKIARLASDPTAGWRLEAGVVAASEPTFDTVTFTARSLAVKFEVSAELFDDSVNINDAIMAARSGSLAVELDRVCLFGSGSAPEPMGIFGQTGVNSVSMGAAGATPTSYSQLLDCLYELELDNAATPTAMVMHPRTRRTFSGFVDTTNQPLQLPPTLASIPQLVTTSVPITQTVGASGAVCSSVIVGDYTQLILGVRQGLRIEVLKSSKYSSNLQYTFLAHLRADVAVAQPKAFCKLIGIKA
jgi:HK97 family phage major capsid protein